MGTQRLSEPSAGIETLDDTPDPVHTVRIILGGLALAASAVFAIDHGGRSYLQGLALCAGLPVAVAGALIMRENALGIRIAGRFAAQAAAVVAVLAVFVLFPVTAVLGGGVLAGAWAFAVGWRVRSRRILVASLLVAALSAALARDLHWAGTTPAAIANVLLSSIVTLAIVALAFWPERVDRK